MDQDGIQLMPKSIIQAHNGKGSKQQRGPGCLNKLRELCVAEPSSWKHMQMYAIGQGGSGCSDRNFTDYTAEFLLTRYDDPSARDFLE